MLGACWGAITGAVIGGVAGGLESMSQGGSFLDGFEDGAFSGAVGGAIGGAAFAGLGVAGAALGKGISCASKLGKAIKGTAAVSKVLSLGMAGFDMISLADMAIDNKNNPIADLNKELHSNKAYNVFQISVSALAVFTGGMTTTMKCFVAGTLVLTSEGLKKIEDIKIGDKVLATDTKTMKSEYKEVLDTFVRKTNELVHIYIGEEEIVTTTDHPFWVKGKGFVPAMNLVIGSKLINGEGHTVCVENILRESNHDGVEVFNFKVEDYHTYYVGESCILVHNANYVINKSGNIEITDWEGYPEDMPKPEGEMKLIEGEKYANARKAANSENAKIHRNNPQYKGKQIHEIKPVKFNGSPVDHENKIVLTRIEHAKLTTFWKRLQLQIEKDT